jgi:hypothetical protein
MNKLLAALGDRVKPAGKDYIARCPIHGDKDFAMTIKQAEDGSVLAHCFACKANGYDLYMHLGLDLDELFGYKELNKTKEWIPPKVKELYEIDKVVVLMFECADSPTWEDRKRYKLAVARIKGTEDKYII